MAYSSAIVKSNSFQASAVLQIFSYMDFPIDYIVYILLTQIKCQELKNCNNI